MNQLENGYSVSETDDARSNIIDGEIVSLGSHFSGLKAGIAAAKSNNDSPDGRNEVNDQNMAQFLADRHAGQFNSALPNAFSNGSAQMDLENQIRNQEQQHMLYQEIASQKIKYFKKIAHLEKLIEQVKGEKAQLHVIIETQK